MRVLMFGWEFPPHITGGLGTACYGITKGLAKQDVKIDFVVPVAHGDEDKSYASIHGAGDISKQYGVRFKQKFWKNVSFKRVYSNLIPYMSPEEYEKNVKSFLSDQITKTRNYQAESFKFSGEYGMNIWDEISRYSYVTSFLAAEKNFDVIHAHDWLTFPAGVLAKEISEKPLIVHVHATEFDRSGENINEEVYRIEKRGMQAADKIIAVSNYTKNIIIDRYGISPDKIEIVHNAVDKIGIPNIRTVNPGNEKIVSFLGRITFQKGPDYFVEAANKVLQKVKNVRFVIAGSGDMRNSLVKKVAKYKISSKVNFAGFLNGEEVKRLHRMTDVYVMPSVSEPFGIAPLEAMQCDVPVIISKQSGVSEVLKYALKVDFWDTDCLADAIHSLLEYKVLSKMLRTNGRNEVSRMQWEDVGKKIASIYRSIV